MTNFLEWLGRFHLLMLHFPIALILAAAMREGWTVWTSWANQRRGHSLARPTWARLTVPCGEVRFCVLAAAFFAVPTVALGWLHALDSGSGIYLEPHRWVGTGAALLLVTTAVLVESDAHAGQRMPITRWLIFASAILIGLTAHLGALMAYGSDFFNW